jgi:hypothetical protein
MTAKDRPILVIGPGQDARKEARIYRINLGVNPIVVRRKPAATVAVRLPLGVSESQYRTAFKQLTGATPEKHAEDTYEDFRRHRESNILPQNP